MKIKSIFYMLVSAAFIAAAGCSDNKEGRDNELPPVLESVSVSLSASGEVSLETRSIDAADPTKTACHNRCGSNHRLAVTIGSQSVGYVYDAGTQKWIPDGVDGIRFPDFGAHDIGLRLCSGHADPVGQQTTGAAANLLHADVLVSEILNQAAVKELPPASMKHKHSMLDIRMDNSLAASDIASVKINDELVPYNVPADGAKSSKYLVIVAPGSSGYEITMNYKGVDYCYTVLASDVDGGEFAAHTRYILSLSLQGAELVCGGILVKPWTESTGAEIAAGSTRFTIAGYEGLTLDAAIGGRTFANVLELDGDGMGRLGYDDLVGLGLTDFDATIDYVQYTAVPGHERILVGMPLGSDIFFTVDPSDGTVLSIP